MNLEHRTLLDILGYRRVMSGPTGKTNREGDPGDYDTNCRSLSLNERMTQ